MFLVFCRLHCSLPIHSLPWVCVSSCSSANTSELTRGPFSSLSFLFCLFFSCPPIIVGPSCCSSGQGTLAGAGSPARAAWSVAAALSSLARFTLGSVLGRCCLLPTLLSMRCRTSRVQLPPILLWPPSASPLPLPALPVPRMSGTPAFSLLSELGASRSG